jgi:hypothetical protein
MLNIWSEIVRAKHPRTRAEPPTLARFRFKREATGRCTTMTILDAATV